MSTIITPNRNYIFPLKDEDLERSINLMRVTTEAIDSDIHALFTTKANQGTTDTSAEVDTKILDAINDYNNQLDIYGTYVNGDVNTDSTLKNKLILKDVVTAGTHTKITYNAKGLVTGGTNIVKADVTNFVETDYVHIAGTETITGSKTFTGSVVLPTASIIDDTSTTTTTKGYSVNKIVGTYVPLTSYTDNNILTKLKTVDGAGSGLDADLLDGQQGSYYSPSTHTHSWSVITSKPTTIQGYGIIPEEIPASIDLDTKTVTALFSQSLNSEATTALHYPEPLAGLLEVFAYSAMIHQRYWVFNTSKVYKRAKYSTGAWTSWILEAPSVSPALTGTPTAPTAVVGTNTTQIATTAFVIANSSNALVANYSTKTTTYTAVANDYIYASTASGSFTITLPASPVANTKITILDSTGNFEVNNLTVARNGQTIMGLAEDILLDVANKEYRFIFTGTTWRVMQ